MGNNKSNENNCNFKCATCQYYNKQKDYCIEKEIEYCSKAATKTDFSTCTDYIINEKLVMF